MKLNPWFVFIRKIMLQSFVSSFARANVGLKGFIYVVIRCQKLLYKLKYSTKVHILYFSISSSFNIWYKIIKRLQNVDYKSRTLSKMSCLL